MAGRCEKGKRTWEWREEKSEDDEEEISARHGGVVCGLFVRTLCSFVGNLGEDRIS